MIYIPQSRRRHHGVALMLVLTVVGLATVMGVAILATASLQAQLQSNTVTAVQAKYLAESGLNLAIYYLQHPQNAPALNNGFYNGQSGVSFGPTVAGTVDISVTNPSSKTYQINATGYAGPNATDRAARQGDALVSVNSTYVIDKAVSVSGNFAVPASMSITGDVRCDGAISKDAAASINGTVIANSYGTGLTAGTLPSYPTAAAPALSQINLYNTVTAASPFYNYTDSGGVSRTGTPQPIGSTVSGVLVAAPSNPMAVWYSVGGDVTLEDCDIGGTIVVVGQNRLIVSGVAHIQATAGMPALIVPKDILFLDIPASKSLTVDGVCWTGGNFDTTSHDPVANCAVRVNGALMMAGVAPQISQNISGAVGVTYSAAKTLVPAFSDVNRTPQSVTIQHWGS